MRFVQTEGNSFTGGSVSSAQGGFPSWFTPTLTRTVSDFDDYDSTGLLVALIVFYFAAVDVATTLYSSPLPNSPIIESAISHSGAGMWMGPGVRFYAC